jgi:hypothetical protein
MRMARLVLCALAGLGMTIYGVIIDDAMWVAFGFPILLMNIHLM